MVLKDYPNTCLVHGTAEDVLLKTRDMVHKGYELISHPLSGSLKTMVSPVRSIVVGRKNEEINILHVETIENSIIKLREHIREKGLDFKHRKDYEKVDLILLRSVIYNL